MDRDLVELIEESKALVAAANAGYSTGLALGEAPAKAGLTRVCLAAEVLVKLLEQHGLGVWTRELRGAVEEARGLGGPGGQP